MKRSPFNLSYTNLASMDMGELIPIGLTEVLPGDTFDHATSALVRCSPLLSPVMHQVHVKIHHWYVPHRLVWDDFEDFITGGPSGMSTPTFPTITFGGGSGAAVGSLADYMGVPTGVNNYAVSALPFRAYALIFNEWYRDQDLQTELVIDKTDGADTTTSVALQNRCWEKDRYTSARPWEQKGPAVTIPLGLTAPVTRVSNASAWQVFDGGTNTPSNASPLAATTGTLTIAGAGKSLGPGNPGLVADLSSASAITVNLLREALALQRFEEARARYGSRYTEYLRYLGVKSSDARLQRPEYLGGGKQTIQFSEVLQTAEGTNPVGELRGHGVAALRSNKYRRFFEEHGYVITLISVEPKTMYFQGSAPTLNRRVKEDFWQKELQHIGQVEIPNKEIYAAHASPDGVFGYQDRYDEYRRSESRVSGEFRSSVLNFWHMARDFSSDPALNATFVKSVPTERTFAVPSEDVLYVMAKHSLRARRLVAPTGTSFIY